MGTVKLNHHYCYIWCRWIYYRHNTLWAISERFLVRPDPFLAILSFQLQLLLLYIVLILRQEHGMCVVYVYYDVYMHDITHRNG